MDFIGSFGLWVRQRRKLLDLTQEELARQVGCSVSAIRKIEADLRRPSRQIAGLLAEHLQVQPEDRDLFLKIARSKASIDHLSALSPMVAGFEAIPAAAPMVEPPADRKSVV